MWWMSANVFSSWSRERWTSLMSANMHKQLLKCSSYWKINAKIYICARTCASVNPKNCVCHVNLHERLCNLPRAYILYIAYLHTFTIWYFMRLCNLPRAYILQLIYTRLLYDISCVHVHVQKWHLDFCAWDCVLPQIHVHTYIHTYIHTCILPSIYPSIHLHT